MKSLIYELFGVYTPVTYTNDLGVEVIPDGLAGVDFPYIFGCLLFAIAFYSLFRILGTFLRGK